MTPGALTRAGAVRVVALAALPPTLVRMRDDVDSAGVLRPSTAALMWSQYALSAAAFGTLLHDAGRPRRGGLAVAGGVLTAAGVGMFVAGARRFQSVGQVQATDPGSLVTGGVYRVSRNPQYVGTLMVLAGLSAATRSAAAGGATAVAAAVYRWWVPVEERALHRTFGAVYADYERATHRWLGPRAPREGSAGRRA